MEQPLPTRRKVLDLVGEAQVNADGVNRQEELARSLPGESVTLEGSGAPGTAPSGITVLSARGVPIGPLTDQYAAMLGPLLAKGRSHRAKLHCLRGGVPGYPSYGARISIAWDDRPEYPHLPLDEAQIRFRRARPQRIERWRRRSGALRVRLLLLGAGGGLLLLAAYGWYLARRIAEAWCWGCS
jgi:hypothetical protein